MKDVYKRQPELLAFHEIFVVTGRCIGLGAFAFINTVSGATLKAQIFSLLLLTLVPFGTVFMLSLIHISMCIRDSQYYRQAFVVQDKPYASAISIVALCLIRIFTGLQFVAQKKIVHYE